MVRLTEKLSQIRNKVYRESNGHMTDNVTRP